MICFPPVIGRCLEILTLMGVEEWADVIGPRSMGGLMGKINYFWPQTL
jgi:hypothetical protein